MSSFSALPFQSAFQALAYGLRLDANVAIPGLAHSTGQGPPDARVHLGALPEGFSADDAPGVKPSPSGIICWTEADYVRIRYADQTEFAVHRDAHKIFAVWPDDLTLEDTATYLLGPILSLVLRLRGTVTLHASAVRIGGVAVLLIGPQGAGKSTTAASFAIAGHPVITDDVAALCDHGASFDVIPAYPRIRLWPQSVEMLFGDRAALPLLTPTWDKRFLALGGASHRFEQDPVRLAAVYFLQPRSDGAAPAIDEEPLRAGMVNLLGNLGGNYLLDAECPAHAFDVLQRLARNVPMRRLTPNSDPAKLGELRAMVIADVEALQGETAPPSPQRQGMRDV